MVISESCVFIAGKTNQCSRTNRQRRLNKRKTNRERESEKESETEKLWTWIEYCVHARIYPKNDNPIARSLHINRLWFKYCHCLCIQIHTYTEATHRNFIENSIPSRVSNKNTFVEFQVFGLGIFRSVSIVIFHPFFAHFKLYALGFLICFVFIYFIWYWNAYIEMYKRVHMEYATKNNVSLLFCVIPFRRSNLLFRMHTKRRMHALKRAHTHIFLCIYIRSTPKYWQLREYLWCCIYITSQPTYITFAMWFE